MKIVTFFAEFWQKIRKSFTKFWSIFEMGAVQRIAYLVVLEKCCKMRIWMQKSASMQKRTSPLKFGDLAEKSVLNSVSNFSTKARTPEPARAASARGRSRRTARTAARNRTVRRPAAARRPAAWASVERFDWRATA